jgi:hypothetical protein
MLCYFHRLGVLGGAEARMQIVGEYWMMHNGSNYVAGTEVDR